MTVSSNAATAAEKEVKTDWPVTEGLNLGTNKLRKKAALEPQEESLVPERKKGGVIMGGKGSGRPPSVNTIINRDKPEIQFGTTGDFTLPNISEVKRAPEKFIFNGNVGIKTDNPDSELHILNGANPEFHIQATDTDSNALLTLENDTQEWKIRNQGADGDNFQISDITNSKTPFRIEPDTATSTIYMDSTGVGIGTASPDYELSVVDASGDVFLNLKSGDTDSSVLLFGSTSDVAEAGIVFNSSDNSLKIRGHNYTDRITISSAGATTITGTLSSTGDNSSADTAYTPNILYNTDATPPAASGFPIGTLYVQYTA